MALHTCDARKFFYGRIRQHVECLKMGIVEQSTEIKSPVVNTWEYHFDQNFCKDIHSAVACIDESLLFCECMFSSNPYSFFQDPGYFAIPRCEETARIYNISRANTIRFEMEKHYNITL